VVPELTDEVKYHDHLTTAVVVVGLIQQAEVVSQ
jgi:hypothetical protein